MRLSFSIISAPGYFQVIIDQLTSDLYGVLVYLDDILVSGPTLDEHFNNLHRLLQRVKESGLRCRLKKCVFAQPTVKYLGHMFSSEGMAKGSKTDAVMNISPPDNVKDLKSYLSSIQFYSKFLLICLQLLNNQTRQDTNWCWGEKQKVAFQTTKDLLQMIPF